MVPFMEPQTFVIKSLTVQNGIMLFSLGIVVFFLARALLKGRMKHVLVFALWVGIVLWFFNSPLFGFSTVTVEPKGIRVNYGILSFRNTVLPLDTTWKIESSLTGIIKTNKLYYIRIGNHESMKVKGKEDIDLLHKIGKAIGSMRAGQGMSTVGNYLKRPSNPAAPTEAFLS